MELEDWCVAPISYCGDIHGKTCVHLIVRVIWILLLCVVCPSYSWPDWVVTREKIGGERRKGSIQIIHKRALSHLQRKYNSTNMRDLSSRHLQSLCQTAPGMHAEHRNMTPAMIDTSWHMTQDTKGTHANNEQLQQNNKLLVQDSICVHHATRH